MDDVIKKLEETLQTSTRQSSYNELYKNRSRVGDSQEERRKELLEQQKHGRNQRMDKFRGIFENLHYRNNDINWRNRPPVYRPTIYVAGFNAVSCSYRDILMFSEWMIEKPNDFEENWYIVPCPKGTRVLLVAAQGETTLYTKYGHTKFQCLTALPGGNYEIRKMSQQCCILDGFYQEKNNTFYILDLLAWNQQPMTDGETEFRHYWLETNLADYADLRHISKKNEIIFSLLPKISCKTASLSEYLMKYPPFEGNFPPLDGFLFYHKKANYISGETPLVGWLFPYMINEVLGADITVHPGYLAGKPPNYVDQATFIVQFEEKNAKKKRNAGLVKTDALKQSTGVEVWYNNKNRRNKKRSSGQMDVSSPNENVATETGESTVTKDDTIAAQSPTDATTEEGVMEVTEVKPNPEEKSTISCDKTVIETGGMEVAYESAVKSTE